MIFDTHVHYDDKKFDEDRDTILTNLKDYHIGTVVNISSDLASVKATLELTKNMILFMVLLAFIQQKQRNLQKKHFLG